MALANPVGSSVTDAAEQIDQLKLLEPEGPTEEKEAAQEDPAPEPESREPEAPAEEQAAPPEEEGEDADTEAGLTLEELPGTIAEFAEEMGLGADDLANHLKVPVTVKGETRMVNLNEVQKGYQLEADYRAKTADLSERGRALDEAGELAVQEWQTRFQALNNLTQQMESSIVGDQDLLQVLETEGVEAYHHAKAQTDARKAQLAEAQKLKAEADEKLGQEQQTKNDKYLTEQSNALLREMPELANEKKAKDFGDRVQGYLLDRGFSPQEISQVVDHKHYLVLRDAMSWRDLKKSEPNVKNKLKHLPKVNKPGAKPEKGDVRKMHAGQKLARLKKSGTRRDAAAVFEEMLS